jgi:hypothetical protein
MLTRNGGDFDLDLRLRHFGVRVAAGAVRRATEAIGAAIRLAHARELGLEVGFLVFGEADHLRTTRRMPSTPTLRAVCSLTT